MDVIIYPCPNSDAGLGKTHLVQVFVTLEPV